ncbi:uncharacterized protein STEHIDRAFT_89651 [Stereum hirsutum FP-91666 SS1]|uniref:uncharacterized protein n=1 Tax=Stereum hirsutum (strain FP-91666) TaxID=721885 RepID=UPI000440CD62|nr:uncharacterized protein STEHIDRAFT_89651 [Stereum hirsutum FP-91666 SS1]EIM92556.1 hypothetical protein STEHIDRAFT_89651 [Stereum hirsutum FP-91666 SS1]
MANGYIFSLQPTFTQGLIIGQFSILFLLAVILKFLFLDSAEDTSHSRTSEAPRQQKKVSSYDRKQDGLDALPESTEWFNLVLRQVVESYRSRLRDDLPGLEGDEVLRRRVEDFANQVRPTGFLDPIRVHSVDLGVSAPRLSNARSTRPQNIDRSLGDPQTDLDLTYTDTVSISLSTAYLFNYPMPAFARLPVSVTISLSLFSSSISIIPPVPGSHAPSLTIRIPPTFTLKLTNTSLLGSRAKLADVPKLHELIEYQIRRQIAQRGEYKIALPGLASVKEVKEEIKKEKLERELDDVLYAAVS